MSIISYKETTDKNGNKAIEANPLSAENIDKTTPVSPYMPSDDEKAMRALILDHFRLGYVTMYTPRVEFNDLSLVQRYQQDQMAWNTYQPNNGLPNQADITEAWRSNAIRPVVRNKCVSIAAHATAHLIFPKVFAHDDDSDEQSDAATVMEDLMEIAADQSNFAMSTLRRVISALSEPASVGYTEFCEIYRKNKRPDGNGGYTNKYELDESMSGFQDTPVPVDELFIENFFEPDIQKQGWLIWRKVISYSLAQAKYSTKYSNFDQYVRPGVQIIYNDANQSFYQVYDWNMRPYDVEEVTYWNKALDVKIVMVNGILLTPADNPNPRTDKQYPFDKFGYELINNRCFYYKSLVFKLQPDADIINTLYQMVVDGTYLNIMPPTAVFGPETIGSDVMVPGVTTTFKSENSKIVPLLQNPQGLRAGYDALNAVEGSLNESSQDPAEQGINNKLPPTAFALSRLEQNASTVLGLFLKMIAQHVKDFGELRMNDILQYWTIADVSQYEDDPKLVYKSFLSKDKKTGGKTKSRKIMFSSDMSSEPKTESEHLNDSYDLLEKEKGKVEIYKVNPEIFRELKYKVVVSPDVLNPRSNELEKAYDLETYDRAILNPVANQEEIYRTLLLGTNDKTKRDPDKFVTKQQSQQPGNNPMEQIQNAMTKPGQAPQPSPMQSMAQPAQPTGPQM